MGSGWTRRQRWRRRGDNLPTKPRNASDASVRRVGLKLDDGSLLAGQLLTFNPDPPHTGSRELVLTAPLSYREPDSAITTPLESLVACVAAARVVAMTAGPELPDDDGALPHDTITASPG
ncbi:DUF6338 family protein [Sciscionella sediminilitoris]|uniref:DUF6338 family protein n=1 Tax=Sciscionella sediminilitoris TaxID=1445613 RepID=UPI003CCE042B